jgi:hypothetical protein
MSTATTPKPPPNNHSVKWVAVPAIVAVAFVLGRGTIDPPARVTARHEDGSARESRIAARERSSSRGGPSYAGYAAAATPQGGAVNGEGSTAAPAPSQIRKPLAPEVQARVHHEVRAEIERLRPQVVARCWPSEGLPGGRRETTVTYDVTFDPQGREIARGVHDDRKAPAGKFGQCLRQLGGTSLSVSPTGTYHSLRLPITYP